MKRIYFLVVPFVVLLALGVLVSSTKSFLGEYQGDASIKYFQGKSSYVLGESTENIVITFTASLLIWFMFLGLGDLWLIDGKIKKEEVLHALIASFLAWVVAELIKQIFHTPRPFLINGTHPLTLTTPTDPAFPSGHEALAFGLAVTIWFHDKKVGIIFLILAVLVAGARVLANVHYPIDTLGGAVIGTVIAVAVEKVHFFVLKRR